MSVSIENGTLEERLSGGRFPVGQLPMNLQLFAESEEAAKPAESAEDKDGDNPAPDASNNGGGDNDSPDSDDLAAQLQALQTKLAKEEKKRKEAEAACNQITRENSKLKRSQMSEAERLAEQQKEADEKARQYDRMMSSIEAEKIFVGSGLKEGDYKDLLDMIASEDKDKTVAIAQGFADVLSSRTTAAAKAEREKILKETPAPPVGGKGDDKDPFIDGFKAG